MQQFVGILLHGGTMTGQGYEAHDAQGRRKYLTRCEGMEFLKAAAGLSKPRRLFCETVFYLGCRITEAVNLTKADIDISASTIRVLSLKKRGKTIYRQIPVPDQLIRDLISLPGDKIWPFTRYTGWRTIKGVMDAAGIDGVHATPRGLRHSFGVRGALGKVPVNCIQRWMGHASPLTTAIYLDIGGPEERELIERTWDRA